jgi:hypothetical protein
MVAEGPFEGVVGTAQSTWTYVDFRRDSRMDRAMFGMVCDALWSAVPEEDTERSFRSGSAWNCVCLSLKWRHGRRRHG